MKKYLIALLLCLYFIYPAFAQEPDEEDYEEVEVNAFGFPDKSFVKLIENKPIESQVSVKDKPACDDEILSEKAKKIVEPFVKTSSNTILNKRRNILITKNVDNFSDLSIEDATKLKNKVVMARMVELKINKKLDNRNFKICQSDNKILKDKLFILMYDDNDNIKVEVLNLAIDEIPSFNFYEN